MTRTSIRTALIAAAFVALVAAGVQAQDVPPVNYIDSSVLPGGGIRDFARRLPSFDGIPAVPLPKPGEPDQGGLGAFQAPVGGALPGPVGHFGRATQAAASTGFGQSLAAPGGSASFMTPQRVGERQIRKLLRRLD